MSGKPKPDRRTTPDGEPLTTAADIGRQGEATAAGGLVAGADAGSSAVGVMARIGTSRSLEEVET